MRTFIFMAFFFFCATFANALQVEVNYSGSIYDLTYSECQSLNEYNSCTTWTHSDLSSSTFYDGFPISIGDSFLGGFTYESSAPMTGISSDGFQGIYLDSVTNYSFSTDSISLPDSSLLSANSNLNSFSVVNNRYGWDTFFVENIFSGTNWFATVSVNLIDKDGTLFDDFSVPTMFDLSQFETMLFHLSFLERETGDQLHAYGNLSEFKVKSTDSPTPVPEPSTLLLFLLGGIAFFGLNFRHSNR